MIFHLGDTRRKDHCRSRKVQSASDRKKEPPSQSGKSGREAFRAGAM